MNYIENQLIDGAFYNIIIEITKGSKNKKELVEPLFDKLETARKIKIKYPFYYGCFSQTLAEDNDALDAVLITTKKFNELDIVKVKPIYILKTIDNEEQDDKVFVIDPTENIKNLTKLINKAIKFLYNYKGKKSNTIIDDTLYGEKEAIKAIKETHDKYNIKHLKNTHSIKIDF